VKGRVFNVQRFSVHDGPGLRTTVFMKGCLLDCAWCHNPESQAVDREEVHQEGLCIRCLECGGLEGDARVEACPTGARSMAGRDVEVEELVEEVLRDRIFFDQSGGGVTFSGGEPLLQADFVGRALAALKERGVHTALDTCGLPGERLLEAASRADLVLYDLKHMDDALHRRWTGAGNGEILANLQALGRVHRNIRVRVPVVPGANDDASNLEAMALFVAALPGVVGVDLLPYHASGAAKFARMGRDYGLAGALPPGPERLRELAVHFTSRGVPAGATP
jgi:pyruvate formate lyase activating enzyme